LENLAIHLLVLVFSVVAHEYAHGLAAYRLGDDTARLRGRLTMNPLNHIDPIGSLVVPVVMFLSGGMMFGWAKPVPVRVGKLNDPKNDHPKVAAAGPVANLMLAFIAALGLGLVVGVSELLPGGAAAALGGGSAPAVFLVRLFQTGIQLNVMLAMFNLVPVPPLDGSWVLSRFLPLPARLQYEHLRNYGFLPVIGFLVLMRVSPLGLVFSKVVHSVYWVFLKVTLSAVDLLT
jgi:Zn-dependent protease